MNSFERKIDDAVGEMRRYEYTRNMLDVGSVATSLIQGCDVMGDPKPERVAINITAAMESFSDSMKAAAAAFGVVSS